MKRTIHVLLGICCLLVVGCLKRTNDGGDMVFRYQLWVPLLVVTIGIILVPVGIFMVARQRRFWGIVVILGGALASLIVAPQMYLDKVIVNQEGFYSRHGWWFSPTIHEIRYDDLQRVQVVVEERQGRHGKNYSYYFDCFYKTGKKERVPLGDVMREAVPEIAEQFRAHGVAVDMPSNLPR
jgi:hypothetical protein